MCTTVVRHDADCSGDCVTGTIPVPIFGGWLMVTTRAWLCGMHGVDGCAADDTSIHGNLPYK